MVVHAGDIVLTANYWHVDGVSHSLLEIWLAFSALGSVLFLRRAVLGGPRRLLSGVAGLFLLGFVLYVVSGILALRAAPPVQNSSSAPLGVTPPHSG